MVQPSPAGGPPGVRPPSAPFIAVVEDDPNIREWVSDLLKDLGPSVLTYSTGQEFLDALRADATGCVVLDLHLPDIDGIAVLAALRERGSFVRAVILTGTGDVAAAVRAMRSGAIDFLLKPPEPSAVRAAVATALASSRVAARWPAGRREAAQRIARLDADLVTVLRLSMSGVTTDTIARHLGVAARTVERRRAAALQELGVSTVVEAATLFALAGK